MSGRLIVVVDAGSTSIRCFVFDEQGRVVVRRSAPWSYLDLGAASPYARELDAPGVWRSTARLIAQCVGDGRVEARRVAAVTVTSQRQGVVFLDGERRVLYAGPNVDLRAIFEGGAIDDEMGARVYEVTGRLPSFLFTPARLRWFRRHEPDTYRMIDRVATLADWLRFELSGELAGEATLAAEAGLLDVRERGWCTRLLEEIGVPAQWRRTRRKGRHGGGRRSPGSRGTDRHTRGSPRGRIARRHPVRPPGARRRAPRAGGRRRRVERAAPHAHGGARVRRRAADLDGMLRGGGPVEPGEHLRRRGQLVPVARRCAMWSGEARPFDLMDAAARGVRARLRGRAGLPGAVPYGHEHGRPAGWRVRIPGAPDLRRGSGASTWPGRPSSR